MKPEEHKEDISHSIDISYNIDDPIKILPGEMAFDMPGPFFEQMLATLAKVDETDCLTEIEKEILQVNIFIQKLSRKLKLNPSKMRP